MTQLRNFQAVETQNLSVTTANSTGSFAATSASWNQVDSVRINNTGSNPALVVFSSTASPTAPSTSPYGSAIVIPNGMSQIFNYNPQQTYFAAICPTGSATLWMTAGYGNT